MDGALIDGWFQRRPVSDKVTLWREPFVHRFFRGNSFLVEGRDRDIVVDTCSGLRSLRAAMGRQDRPVLAVATHAHCDHVGCLHEFECRAGHAADADALATMPDERTVADLLRGHPAPVECLPHEGWRAADYRLVPAPLTEPLKEGDHIDLGDRRLTVLHLPGHSPDSIALLDEHTGDFFTGDTVYDGYLVDDLPGSDRFLYLATMMRLLTLPIRTVYGGHGEPFGIDRLRAIARGYVETVDRQA